MHVYSDNKLINRETRSYTVSLIFLVKNVVCRFLSIRKNQVERKRREWSCWKFIQSPSDLSTRRDHVKWTAVKFVFVSVILTRARTHGSGLIRNRCVIHSHGTYMRNNINICIDRKESLACWRFAIKIKHFYFRNEYMSGTANYDWYFANVLQFFPNNFLWSNR